MTPLKAALLGRELSHSISDGLHQELFGLVAPKCGITATSLEYELVGCHGTDLFSTWMMTAAGRGYFGANATCPYKSDLYELSAVRVGAAGSIRSANTARFMGGVAGHAGLFSTADDLARFAQMMLNEGELDGVRLFNPLTVAKFTSPQTPPDQPILRGLGFAL